MSDQPDLSTLPKRMRYAAEVLREVDRRHDSRHMDYPIEHENLWRAGTLTSYGSRWEDEDREAAEREAQVEELAQDLFSILWPSFRWNLSTEETKTIARIYARALTECGWAKGEPEC